MMEAMQQTVEDRHVAWSSVKLAKASERGVVCGKYYNHKMYQKEKKYTAQQLLSNTNKGQREGRTVLS